LSKSKASKQAWDFGDQKCGLECTGDVSGRTVEPPTASDSFSPALSDNI